MIDCDWILCNSDGTTTRITLKEAALPNAGEGKMHNGIGYKVILVGSNLLSRRNPVAVADQV